MRKRALIGLVAALGGIALWLALAPGADSEPEKAQADQTTAKAKAEAPAKLSAPPGPRPLAKPARLAGVHDLRYALVAEVGSGGQAATMSVDGALEVAPVLELADAQWLPLRLVGAKVRQDQVAVALSGRLEPEALQTPWLVRLQSDGRVAEVRFAPQTAEPVQALLASLALSAQFTRPAAPAAQAWDAEEHELNGVFRAQYARKSDGNVTKRRQNQQGRWPQVDATTEFAFDPSQAEPQLLQVTVAERGQAPVGGMVQGDHTWFPYRIDIALRRTGAGSAGWAQRLDPATMVAFATRDRAARRDRPTRPFAAVVAQLKTLPQEAKTKEFVGLRDELARAIRDQPGMVAAADQLLRSAALSGDAEVMAVAALVSARSPQAQLAAAELVGDDALRPTLRALVLQAVTQLDQPSSAMVAAVQNLAVTGPNTALGRLAANTLGAQVAWLIDAGDTDAAASALAAMLGEAAPIVAPATFVHPGQQEANIATRVGWLSGLGNTRHAAALPILLAALNEPEEMVRAHAAFALRHQDPQACFAVMAEVMSKEKSMLVRSYIVDAARTMGPAATQPIVEKALRFDESPRVRVSAAYAIGVWMVTAPGLSTVLQEALAKEKSPVVAEAILEHLQPGRSLATASKSDWDPDAHPGAAAEAKP